MSAEGSRGAATLLFRGGSVFDGRRHLGRADVLVRDGLIAAVGRDLSRGYAAELTAGISAQQEVDCTGRLVSPGFVDAHVHPVQGGLERIRCDLSQADTREACLATVAAYAERHPSDDWLLGGGWPMAAFPGGLATAAELDAVVADRPVFLPNRDHHDAWVNTRALQVAGITEATPDPADGRIARDERGRPTGTLHEGAMKLVSRLLPPTTEEQLYAGLLAGQEYLHSMGVTSWQDAIVGGYAGMVDPGPTYRRAAERGDLLSHVVGALWWVRECERDRVAEQVGALVRQREVLSTDRFRATSVKIMLDGVVESRTAALTEPYLEAGGRPGTDLGPTYLDPDTLRVVVSLLDAAEFQVHVHAIGDRAVRESLDAFAGLAEPEANRHQIAHLQLVHPADVRRFGELGVTANIQALWACLDDQMVDLNMPLLGDQRAGWQYPFGDLHRGRARLGAGSDWPVSTPDPLAAMHVAVNRTMFGASGRAGHEPLLPGQALGLAAAWRAYTSGSAWLCHRDDAGSLTPGNVADLVVCDRDPFAGPPSQIGGTQVVSTWIEGRCVYEAVS